ncbi:MAG TPA: hypothetical protein VIT91_02930 [Chthoniobacterales bacterium]
MRTFLASLADERQDELSTDFSTVPLEAFRAVIAVATGSAPDERNSDLPSFFNFRM